MAEVVFRKLDEYGFKQSNNYDKFMSGYIRTLTRRSQRWNTLRNDRYEKTNKLKRFVRKGIPGHIRKVVWMRISGAYELKQRNSNYLKLRNNILNSEINDTIEIDLPRTYPDNVYFKSDEALPKMLFNVLATFAHQNKEVGYCQGLNYIAGLLLLSTKDEESSFWLLKSLVEQILPQYYIKTMRGLLVDLDVLDEIVRKYEPTVHRHIKNVGMPWAMGATKWFICIYAEVLPTETVFRIWDCLFYEGSKILFRVALTLISLHKENILQTSELGELIGCFRDMRNHPSVLDCHLFMKLVFKQYGKLSNTMVENLRSKYGN